MAGLYLHIPFCKQACHYCDFHFSTTRNNKGQLISALCTEAQMQRDYLGGEAVETIYFGGGTPSLLSAGELDSIFCSIHENFRVINNAEVTLEANPDDLTPNKLPVFRQYGINRLSIGIQSFDAEVLKFLNRVHSAADGITSIRNARNAGFANISIDLIYSIPGQSREVLKKNIGEAIALDPEHISAYSLTIEEKTVFGNWQKHGKLKVEPDEVSAFQMEMLINELGGAGYEQYEISNFSKPGFYSRHNSSYWRQKKYLGLGPSAHSYKGVSRQSNISNNASYIKAILEGQVPFQIEVLSRANQINEFLLTTLRTHWGCDLDYLVKQFDFDLLTEKKDEIGQFQSLELLEQKGNLLFLTHKGKLLADKIAADLFTE